MRVFDEDFSVEMFQLLLLQFNPNERARIADSPNIVRQPSYSRRIRKAFDDSLSFAGCVSPSPLEVVPRFDGKKRVA